MSTEMRDTRMGGSKVITGHSHWNWLYQISSAAALSVGIIFLIAVIDFVRAGIQPGIRNGSLSLLQNNWLVVIFKLHAGFNGIQPNLLYRLNLLDIAILALVGTTFLGLYAALKRTSNTWSLIALVQPFVGIVLFIATKTAGRSGVMGAGLVISFVMLRSKLFNTRIASIGILSGVMLLAGDIGAGLAPSNFLADLMGIGYMLMMIWFFLVAHRLFQLGLGDRGDAK